MSIKWRLHLHWTAGAPGIIPLERDHYNYVVDDKACVWAGSHPPEAQTPDNIKRGSKYYAAHTLNANSYAIGLAIDAMANAVEVPFDPGNNPITQAQLDSAIMFSASLCKKYGIPVERDRVLTHAEVQPTLGIKQNNKWDIMWLPGMAKPGKALEVGDHLRALIKEALK